LHGNTRGASSARARSTRRGHRPWHVQTLLVREPGDLRVGQVGQRDALPPVRIGKARSRSR
jgi:hypothetical protein